MTALFKWIVKSLSIVPDRWSSWASVAIGLAKAALPLSCLPWLLIVSLSSFLSSSSSSSSCWLGLPKDKVGEWQWCLPLCWLMQVSCHFVHVSSHCAILRYFYPLYIIYKGRLLFGGEHSIYQGYFLFWQSATASCWVLCFYLVHSFCITGHLSHYPLLRTLMLRFHCSDCIYSNCKSPMSVKYSNTKKKIIRSLLLFILYIFLFLSLSLSLSASLCNTNTHAHTHRHIHTHTLSHTLSQHLMN